MQPNDPLTPSGDNPQPETNIETTSSPQTDSGPVTEQQPASPAPSIEPTPPAPVNGVVTPVAATTTADKKGFLKSKKAKLVALVVGVFVLLGGSAAAYYGMVLPNQPQRIVQQSLANSLNQEKVQSVYFEGEVSLSEGEVSEALSGVSFSGASSQEGALNLTVIANTSVTKINLDVKSQDSQTFYVRLSGLDGLDKLLSTYMGGSEDESGLTSMIGPIIGEVNDQWYMVDKSLLNQDIISNAESQISAEDSKKIGEIYKKHQFLQVDKKLVDEKIHDVNSFHIQATIKKDELIAFLNEVKAANIKALPVEQEMIDEVAKMDFSKYPFEMWVSKSDRMITQLATTFEQDGTKGKIRIAFFDYNKPVTVEKPLNAKSVLELLGELSPLATGATDLPLTTQ